MTRGPGRGPGHVRSLAPPALAAGVVALTPEPALVGHNGWADGRYGNYERSEVLLNNHLLIEELARLDERDRLRRLHAPGDEAAAHSRAVLPRALARSRRQMLSEDMQVLLSFRDMRCKII